MRHRGHHLLGFDIKSCAPALIPRIPALLRTIAKRRARSKIPDWSSLYYHARSQRPLKFLFKSSGHDLLSWRIGILLEPIPFPNVVVSNFCSFSNDVRLAMSWCHSVVVAAVTTHHQITATHVHLQYTLRTLLLLLLLLLILRGKEMSTNRSIKCNPLAVSTMPLISPGFNAKAASSNSFCMSPRPK